MTQYATYVKSNIRHTVRSSPAQLMELTNSLRPLPTQRTYADWKPAHLSFTQLAYMCNRKSVDPDATISTKTRALWDTLINWRVVRLYDRGFTAAYETEVYHTIGSPLHPRGSLKITRFDVPFVKLPHHPKQIPAHWLHRYGYASFVESLATTLPEIRFARDKAPKSEIYTVYLKHPIENLTVVIPQILMSRVPLTQEARMYNAALGIPFDPAIHVDPTLTFTDWFSIAFHCADALQAKEQCIFLEA